jgi:hypothetical protein
MIVSQHSTIGFSEGIPEFGQLAWWSPEDEHPLGGILARSGPSRLVNFCENGKE